MNESLCERDAEHPGNISELLSLCEGMQGIRVICQSSCEGDAPVDGM